VGRPAQPRQLHAITVERIPNTEAGIGFTIVTAISQNLVKHDPAVGLAHDPGPIPKAKAGPRADQTPGNQMGPRIADDRQLGPETPMIGVSLGVADGVRTGMPRLQARGVHGPLGYFAQQTQDAGTPKDGIEQAVRSPFSPSRFSACQRVE
jgi:hypothetical protein